MRGPKIGGVGRIIRKVLAAALHLEEEIVASAQIEMSGWFVASN